MLIVITQSETVTASFITLTGYIALAGGVFLLVSRLFTQQRFVKRLAGKLALLLEFLMAIVGVILVEEQVFMLFASLVNTPYMALLLVAVGLLLLGILIPSKHIRSQQEELLMRTK